MGARRKKLVFNSVFNLYHHHMLTREDEKIYFKQKEDSVRDDWYKLIEADLKFVEIEFNEEKIYRTPKKQI